MDHDLTIQIRRDNPRPLNFKVQIVHAESLEAIDQLTLTLYNKLLKKKRPKKPQFHLGTRQDKTRLTDKTLWSGCTYILTNQYTSTFPHTCQYSLIQMSTVNLKQINQLTFVIGDTILVK